MKDHRGVVGHHEPKHHIAKGMEEGEDAEDSFILVEMEHLCRTLAVGVDAEMREHDAFGLTGAPAAENDGGQAIRGERGGLSTDSFDDPTGRKECQQGGLKFVRFGDRFRQILQPDDGRPLRELELGLLHE